MHASGEETLVAYSFGVCTRVLRSDLGISFCSMGISGLMESPPRIVNRSIDKSASLYCIVHL